MFIPGLVSITYRPLTPAQLIALTRTAGLSAIEWGGDVHVPHGNTGAAARVGGMTRGAGLDTISYGTYYKAGTYGSAYADTFAAMLDTADALGAPNLRLWAGGKNSQDVTADELLDAHQRIYRSGIPPKAYERFIQIPLREGEAVRTATDWIEE